MKVTRSNDKWYVDCGKVTRDWTANSIRWCYEQWGPGWGDHDTKLDHTIFIFHRLDHATWFILRWRD